MEKLLRSEIATMTKEELVERFNLLVEALSGVQATVSSLEQPGYMSPIQAHLRWQEVTATIDQHVKRPFQGSRFEGHAGVEARPIDLDADNTRFVKM